MSNLRIQVLGPVRAWRDDVALEIGPPGQRAVLGVLALVAGRPLTRNELISAIWCERRPPASAVNVIQTYVKHLRQILEPGRAPRTRGSVLRQIGDGYTLHVDRSEVDIVGFRRRLAAASVAVRGDEIEHAARLIDEGLAMWHGPPLSDLPLLAAHPGVVALAAERYDALARYGHLMLTLGRRQPAAREGHRHNPVGDWGHGVPL